MKKTLLVAVTIVGLTATLATMQAAKPPQVVKLSMVIEGALTDGATPTTIADDGLGPYVNASEGVSVQFGSAGTLFANLWPQSDFGPRNVSFDHSALAPYGSPEPTHPELVRTPPSGVLANPHFGTGLVGANATPIQSMTVGTSQCLTFWWAFSGASPSDNQAYTWRDNYHSNNADTPDSFTAFAVVTRNSSTTWTVESNKNQGPCPNLNQISQDAVSMVLHDTTLPGKRGSTTYTVKDGYYIMPFRLTLTALP